MEDLEKKMSLWPSASCLIFGRGGVGGSGFLFFGEGRIGRFWKMLSV